MNTSNNELTYLNTLDKLIEQGQLSKIAIPQGWTIIKNYLVDANLSYFYHLNANDDIFWATKNYPCEIILLVYGKPILVDDKVMELTLTLSISFYHHQKLIAGCEFEFQGYANSIILIEQTMRYIHQHLYETVNHTTCQALFDHLNEIGKSFMINSNKTH